VTAQVHRHHRVPVVVGHVEQHAVAGDPRVVHDDAQAAEAVGRVHQFVGRGPLADVAPHGDGLGTGAGDLVDDVGFVERARDVIDHDGRARSSKPDGLGAAQARGRTRHHRDQSGQIGRVTN
jgi:hypothetical protein